MRHLHLILVFLLAACAGAPEPSPIDRQRETASRQQAEDFNVLLTQSATRAAAMNVASVVEEYRVGPGDEIEIKVFQVEDFDLTERINSRGTIMLPLLGEVEVGGLSVAEIEQTLADRLGADYLQDPQVSVFVTEYRSREISVAGAVDKPSVYTVDRPRTVLEMISLAGGVTDEAGYKVHVQTLGANPETGQPEPVNLIVDLRELVNSYDTNRQLVLGGGDSVYVRKAGFVYVEGAVRKPGAYQIEGEATVLKTLAQAGGTLFEADDDSIQVFRDQPGDVEILTVSLDQIRKDPTSDVRLQDGDIVVVGDNAIKAGVAGLWRGITGIFRVSY